MNLKKTVILLAAVLLLAGPACENIVRDFDATLNGSSVVPPVTTTATGNAVVTIDASSTELGYKVTVNNLSNITGANIHLAPAYETGDAVLILYTGVGDSVPFTGTLTEGTLRIADFKGPLAGEPMSRMLNVLRAGSTYVQVTTDSFPGGEIRGQLR
ncbi:CHRD domain-containing protein [candidate division WOR-3 bacterium]|nr:CHRD domain-containing protein [candidate division WOR-3 bacterium]